MMARKLFNHKNTFLIHLIILIFSLFLSLTFFTKPALALCNPIDGGDGGVSSPIIRNFNASVNLSQGIVSFSGEAHPGLDCSTATFCLGVGFSVTNTNIGDSIISYYCSNQGGWDSFSKSFFISNLSSGTYTLKVIAYGPPNSADTEKTFNFTIPSPTCSPSSQNVQVGQSASFSASGGMLTGSYSWSAPGGNPSSGTGSSFSTSYSTPGTKTVTVKKGNDPVGGTCTVNVVSGDGGGGGGGGGGGTNPTASLTSNYNSILKGNSVTLSWTSTNADRCDSLAGAGFETGGSTSGSDEVSALAGDTTFSIRCYKDSNGNGYYDNGEPSAQASKTVTVFEHNLHVDAALYPQSCNQGTAGSMGNIPVSITLNQKPDGASSNIVSPGIYGVWGTMPKSFSITNASASGYVFCGSSAAVSFNSISDSQTKTLTAFFAPSGGGTGNNPTYVISPFQGSISQCNSTFQFTGFYDPDGPGGSQGNQDVTSNATWSSSNENIAQYVSPGKFKGISNGTVTITSTYNNIQATATLNVSGCGSGNQITAQLWAEYPEGNPVSQVPRGTEVIMKWTSTNADRCDRLAGAGFETGGLTSGSDEVSALDGDTTFSIRCTNSSGGSAQANYTVKVFTPTYVISPFQGSINKGYTFQFTGFYDPDGPDGPQGQQNVTSNANWSSSNSSIASSLGNGQFKGESAGSVTISSVYSGITANAILDVSDVSNDFSVSISPSSQSVSRGGSVSYGVTISPIGNFSGLVNLSVGSLASGLSGSFSPQQVNITNDQSKNSTLTITASNSAALGASSFTVTGTSGNKSHQVGATIIVDSGSGLSCTLSSKSIGFNQFEVSIDINNGSGSYGCRFFGPGQNDIDYFNCSPRTYTVGSGDNTVKADVVDRNDASKTTSCSIDLGQGPPPPKTRSQLNFGFFRRDANNQWVYISWPQFGGKDKVNFSMNFDDSVLEINGERNLDYLGRINADEGTYTFRDWISPDNYVLDHIVYEGGTDSTHNSCRFTSAWNQSCTVKIYLRKTKTILDISSKIAPLEGDHPAVKCEGNRGKIICVCDFKYSNYLTGSKVVLSGPAGEVTLDNGKYEFSSSGSLRFGNYTVSQVNPLSGYKLVNPIGCNFVGGGSQNSSLESKRFLSGLFSFFGDGLSSLVRKALAFFQGPKGFWPESFSAEDGGDDVFLTIFLSESNDYCSLSASPTTVISGQYSTLQWECSKPDGKSCIVKDDSNNVVVDNANPSGGTEKVKVRKTTTYTLSCTGVDDSYVTVRVSFLKKIREIIPW